MLEGVQLSIARAERVAIVGASGSGKTTLLQILGGLDRPSTGTVLVDGRDIHSLSESERGALRNHALGFVYQFHHLLPEFSALENVAMPLLVRRMPGGRGAQRRARACSSGSAWARASSTARTSSPAASASAPRWRARWSPSRASCWRMSPPATSTAATPRASSR